MAYRGWTPVNLAEVQRQHAERGIPMSEPLEYSSAPSSDESSDNTAHTESPESSKCTSPEHSDSPESPNTTLHANSPESEPEIIGGSTKKRAPRTTPHVHSSESEPEPVERPTKRKRPHKVANFGYPATTTDGEILAGNPDFIDGDNLFRLHKNWTFNEIVKEVLANHPDCKLTTIALSKRLARALERIGLRDNRSRGDVLGELRQSQQANGITANGKRKAPMTVQAGGGRVKRRKLQVVTQQENMIHNAEDDEEDENPHGNDSDKENAHR